MYYVAHSIDYDKVYQILTGIIATDCENAA